MQGKKFLIAKNIPREGPGMLEALLQEKGVAYDVVEFGSLPPAFSLGGYFAMAVFGGPDSANDPTPKMKQELSIVQDALAKGMPYLGICLGMQALVKAGGGKVKEHSMKEIGFRSPDGNFFSLEFTPAGKASHLLAGMPHYIPTFQLHGETVELAPGMKLLAQGKFCANQIVQAGKSAFGVQSHFELTPAMLEDWLLEDDGLKQCDAQAIRADFDEIKGEYGRCGRLLFGNFLRLAEFY